MALSIPLTSTTNAYTDANAAVFDFGGTPYNSGYLYVQNAAANVSIKVGVGQGQTNWGTDFPVSPSLLPFTAGQSSQLRTGQSIFGVRATSLAAGVPAVIYGAFFQGGDASLIPSAQVSGTITTGGDIVSGGTVIAGTVNADGTIASGAGFTVNHSATGTYIVTFTTAFATTPVTVITPFDTGFASGNFYVPTIGAQSTTGFTAFFGNLSAGAHNIAWNFTSESPSST